MSTQRSSHTSGHRRSTNDVTRSHNSHGHRSNHARHRHQKGQRTGGRELAGIPPIAFPSRTGGAGKRAHRHAKREMVAGSGDTCACGCDDWQACRCERHCLRCDCHSRHTQKVVERAQSNEAAAIMALPGVATSLRFGGQGTDPVKTNEFLVGSVEEQMLQLWDNHVFLTREVIIALATNRVDGSTSLRKLLGNQDEIAALFTPLYGTKRAAQLATLLREHIDLAGQLINALLQCRSQVSVTVASTDDKQSSTDIAPASVTPLVVQKTVWTMCTQVTAIQTQWSANGRKISELLFDLNPGLFDQLYGMSVTVDAVKGLRAQYKQLLDHHFDEHLKLTSSEVIAYLSGEYEESIQIANRALKQARLMALLLAKIACGYQSPPPAILHHQLFQARYRVV